MTTLNKTKIKNYQQKGSSQTRKELNSLDLKKTLELHQSVRRKNSFSKCFGDPYLVKFNPIYRRIRDAGINRKVRYTNKNTLDYLTCQHLYLPKILVKKEIPIVENIEPVESLLKSNFNFKVRHLKSLDLAENHLLHETCHAISDTILKNEIGYQPKSKNEKIMLAIVSEAFAHTCEALGYFYIDEIFHEFFYRMSTHIHVVFRSRQEMFSFQKKYGEKFVFYLTFLGFFLSSFLFKSIPFSIIRAFLKKSSIPSLSPPEISAIQRYLHGVCNLSNSFRYPMTETYFNFIGIKGPVENSLSKKLARSILDNTYLEQSLKAFASILYP